MDLKNFPMDIQTCTMQLESCECLIIHGYPHSMVESGILIDLKVLV